MAEKTDIYFFPGQGADKRQFNKIRINPEKYNTNFIEYSVPGKGMTMTDYAFKLSSQIDTSKKFILIGVSLGGMLATEISTILSPEKIILISSAKSKHELPSKYTFQTQLPLYKLVSPKMSKKGAQLLQPIVEPDRKQNNKLFDAMLADKNQLFLRRTIEMIINWEREFSPQNIIHIHGDNDNTIPVKNVKYDYLVKKGSHMMVYTKADEINKILSSILN